MSQSDDAPGGRLVWEVIDSTGQVLAGQRDLRPTDFEVLVSPPPDTPRLDLLRLGPRKVVTDTVGWLLKGGKGSSSRRARLSDGFWLVLPQRLTPARPTGMALNARRDGERTFCWEWFDVDDDGSTATKRQEVGTLQLEWAQDRNGFEELAATAFLTDVTLRLSSASTVRDEPIWQVRILAGSAVRWPLAHDGVRLVPQLRLDRR